MSDHKIRIELLGPVRLFVDSHEVRFPEQRVLVVLAALALDHQFTVNHQELAACLVGEGSELQSSTLRNYAAKLRNLIGDSALPRHQRNRLQLVIDRDSVDYWCFIDLVESARGQEPNERLTTLRAAADLWRGDRPLSNLRNAHFEDEVRKLDSLRRSAMMDLIDAQCSEGLEPDALADAGRAALLWPLDEEVCLKHMQVCSLLGRPSAVREALEKYTRALAQVQAEPEQHLVEVATRLAESAQLARRARTPGEIGTPRQLPAVRMSLYGREKELSTLDELLREHTEGGRGVALVGAPGVGKTSLALYWAHRSAEHFADGVLYANLDGFSNREPKSTTQVLAGFVEALGGRTVGVADDVLAATYRSLLAAKSVLVVLDNASDYRQIRDLLPAGSKCVTVTTSRSRLPGLRFGSNLVEVVVGPLNRKPALAMLGEMVGRHRVETDAAAAASLVEVCGRLPLALVVVAAQATRRPLLTLGMLAKQLDTSASLLDERDPTRDDVEIRIVLAWSYQHLSDAAAHLFRMIGVHPGQTVDFTALRYLNEGFDTFRAVNELLDSSLVVEVEPGRFTAQNFLRQYAVELAGELPQAEQESSYERVLEHLLHMGHMADKALSSGRDLQIGEPPYHLALSAFRDAGEATEWFELEYPAYLAALRTNTVPLQAKYRWQLPLVIITHQLRAGHWSDAEKMLKNALPAAGTDAPLRHQATVHRMLGNVRRKLNNYSQASTALKDAIEFSRLGGDPLGEAHGHQMAGTNQEDAGNWNAARTHFDAAFALYSRLRDTRGLAHALNGCLSHDLAEGRLEAARDMALEALAIIEKTTDRYGHAAVLRNAARCCLRLGEPRQAAEYADAAVDIYLDLRAAANEAQVQEVRAEAYDLSGRHSEAVAALVRAKSLLTALDRPRQDDETRLRRIEERLARWRAAPSSHDR